MTISETQKIDIIGTRPGSRIVRLVITDHLEWDDFRTHALLLQEKINAYLEFVESGQLGQLKTPVIPEQPEIQIELALQYPPSPEAEALFAKMRSFLEELSIEFVVRIH